MIDWKLNQIDFVRKGNLEFREDQKRKNPSDNEWLNVMTEYAELIESLIVLYENKAVIDYPSKNILNIL